MQERTINATERSCIPPSAPPNCVRSCRCFNASPARYVTVLALLIFIGSRTDLRLQLSEKWKEELVATGELDVMINKWLSRATLDVIGEGM